MLIVFKETPSKDHEMAFVIERQANEEIVLEVEYTASEKSEPFGFGLTNRAVFLPAKKRFVLTNDPFYFERVPLEEVREVHVRRLRSVFLNVLAILMIAVGLYASFGMYFGEYARQGRRIRGWPFAVTVAGFVLPFAARGRHGLVITFRNRKFRWKPPLVIDRASKERIAQIFAAIIKASRKVGLRVVDDRVSTA